MPSKEKIDPGNSLFLYSTRRDHMCGALILCFSCGIWWLSLRGCGEDCEIELEERRKKTRCLGTFFSLCKFLLTTKSL